MRLIGADALEGRLDWPGAVAALEAGHRLARAELGDVFLGPGDDTLMARAARIEGLGAGVKTFTVRPGNAALGLPSVQGAMLVYGDDGAAAAAVDFASVTRWKTVADSLLGAKLLARRDPRVLVICGAGAVAGALAEGYAAIYPGLEAVRIWNRSPAGAQALAARLVAQGVPAEAAGDLRAALRGADIVAAATMATEPILRGAWLEPHVHLDLVGAFKADMREADDAALQALRVFVDSRESTAHIGEIAIPLAAGVIGEADIVGDLYDLLRGDVVPERGAGSLYKNGGGAHLDLMIARWMVERAE